ncbi:hypothetical protein HAX54_034717, partial [Datura stramonium]|nr:hypothetical protein [Datura stramonium]
VWCKRFTEELTAHRPLDSSSLCRRGFEGRNDDRQSGDRPSRVSSRLDGEDDGPSGRRQTVVCVIGENLISRWVTVGLTNHRQCDCPSHPRSLSPINIPSMDKGDDMNEDPSWLSSGCPVVEILHDSQGQFCNLLCFQLLHYII